MRDTHRARAGASRRRGRSAGDAGASPARCSRASASDGGEARTTGTSGPPRRRCSTRGGSGAAASSGVVGGEDETSVEALGAAPRPRPGRRGRGRRRRRCGRRPRSWDRPESTRACCGRGGPGTDRAGRDAVLRGASTVIDVHLVDAVRDAARDDDEWRHACPARGAAAWTVPNRSSARRPVARPRWAPKMTIASACGVGRSPGRGGGASRRERDRRRARRSSDAEGGHERRRRAAPATTVVVATPAVAMASATARRADAGTLDRRACRPGGAAAGPVTRRSACAAPRGPTPRGWQRVQMPIS